jgi:hypothetical protein
MRFNEAGFSAALPSGCSNEDTQLPKYTGSLLQKQLSSFSSYRPSPSMGMSDPMKVPLPYDSSVGANGQGEMQFEKTEELAEVESAWANVQGSWSSHTVAPTSEESLLAAASWGDVGSGVMGASAGFDVLPAHVTTVIFFGMPMYITEEIFVHKLTAWGLEATYDFLFMPDLTAEATDRKAVVNFTKPSFARLCQRSAVTSGFPAQVHPSIVQGAEANIAVRNHMLWAQKLLESDPFMTQAASDPFMMQAAAEPPPAPYEQATSEQEQQQQAAKSKPPKVAKDMAPKVANPQFHKTKMCMFFQKNRCALGNQCAFAHQKQELHDQPDLLKTKLCYNFLRGRCARNPCNYAHGNNELRNGDGSNNTKVHHGISKVERRRQHHKSEASTTDSDGKTTPCDTDEGKHEDLLFPPGLSGLSFEYPAGFNFPDGEQ